MSVAKKDSTPLAASWRNSRSSSVSGSANDRDSANHWSGGQCGGTAKDELHEGTREGGLGEALFHGNPARGPPLPFPVLLALGEGFQGEAVLIPHLLQSEMRVGGDERRNAHLDTVKVANRDVRFELDVVGAVQEGEYLHQLLVGP